MTPPRHRVHLRRAGLAVLVLVLLGVVNVAIALAQDDEQTADPDLLARGEQLFGQDCAICHGDQGRGLEQEGRAGGPPLTDVGAASVDFMLRTGRMPAESQQAPLRRSRPAYDDTDRAALVAYVTTFGSGEGAAIPDIEGWQDADLGRGLQLFTTNCAACHGPTAAGIAVGQNDISSNLDVASPLEIAEAVRSGPGVMPVFSQDVMGQEDLEAVTAWVMNLRDRESPGGLSIGRSGPVTEGFVAWLVGLGLLGIVMYLLGEKAGDEGTHE